MIYTEKSIGSVLRQGNTNKVYLMRCLRCEQPHAVRVVDNGQHYVWVGGYERINKPFSVCRLSSSLDEALVSIEATKPIGKRNKLRDR